jgi:hypothetical protein
VKTDQEMDKQLDQAIAKLPKELMPEQDLWLQLEPRLQNHSDGRQGWAGISQALAAVAVFAVAGMLAWRVLLIPGSGDDGIQIAGDNVDYGHITGQQAVIEEYEKIKAEKLGNVGLVSEYFGDWRYQLAVWDQAIGQVRDALEYYPDEPQLLSQMSGLYQQQLNYLQMVSVVDINEYSWMGNEP